MKQMERWTPPQTVTVTLLYRDGTTQRLWTTEAVFPPPSCSPRVRWFLACGPARHAVPPIERVFVTGLPPNAYAVLWTTKNALGETVFAQPKMQLN